MVATTVNQALDQLLSKYSSEQLQQNNTLRKWRGVLSQWKMWYGGNYKLQDPAKVNHVIETGQEN
jgi:hypothetical protein